MVIQTYGFMEMVFKIKHTDLIWYCVDLTSTEAFA